MFEFLLPATKLGQGNIFRSVCQEFCSQGGMCAGGHAWQMGCAWWWAYMAGCPPHTSYRLFDYLQYHKLRCKTKFHVFLSKRVHT